MSFFSMQNVTKVVSAISGNRPSQREIATQLLEACKSGDIEKVNECLSMRRDFNINLEEKTSGFTALKYAVFYGHYEIVSMLLGQNGIDLEYCGGKQCVSRHFLDFEAPIYLAVCQSYKNEEKYLKIIELLYKSGANINIETMQYQSTPLLACVKGEYLSIFKYLMIKPDIILNKRNGNKWNALHFAAFYNTKQTEIMQLLLETNKIQINDATFDGSTPLHIAIRSWPMIETNNIQQRKVKLLLKYGADIKKRDKFKKTAFEYCNKDKAYFMQLDNDEDDEKKLYDLYPTPSSNKAIQEKLLNENEKLKTEVAKLQEKFESLILGNEEKKEKEDSDTFGRESRDEIWQQEDEYKQFVEWLTNKVKLKQYLSNFEQEGWSDIRLVPDINKSELENLAITRSGHQRIILKEVEKYKKKLQQKNEAEGANTNDYM